MGRPERARGFRLHPVTNAAQRLVGGNCRADAGTERIEHGVTTGALHNRLDLGAAPVVVQRHLGLPRLAVSQYQRALSAGMRSGSASPRKAGGGQGRKPRIQRGKDGFGDGGHVETSHCRLLLAQSRSHECKRSRRTSGDQAPPRATEIQLVEPFPILRYAECLQLTEAIGILITASTWS